MLGKPPAQSTLELQPYKEGQLQFTGRCPRKVNLNSTRAGRDTMLLEKLALEVSFEIGKETAFEVLLSTLVKPQAS